MKVVSLFLQADRLLTGTDSNTVIEWDVQTQTQHREYVGHKDWVNFSHLIDVPLHDLLYFHALHGAPVFAGMGDRGRS